MGLGSLGYFFGRSETANQRRSDGARLGVIYRPGAMISQFSIYYADYYVSL
jgi:hypothetical protein